MDHFDGLRVEEQKNGNGRTRNQIGKKTFLDFDLADDLSILDESVSKMNEL